MCLSTVCQRRGAEEIQLFDNVAKVSIDGTHLTFTDLMGRRMEFTGTVAAMDFLENKLIVEKAEGSKSETAE
jgi:predicted RNA-binding protein